MKISRHWIRQKWNAPSTILPHSNGHVSPPPSPPPPSHNLHLSTSSLPPPYDGPMTSTIPEKGPSVMILLREDYVSARAYLKELNYRTALKQALRRQMYKWYAIIGVAIVLTALITMKHDAVVHFCRPLTQKIRSWPAGWAIPIMLLIVLSFPPLVGHEIIGILVGLVWGLGAGFVILAAGTFLGEIATWVAFKWCCQARAQKFEAKNKLYASLTELIRTKSFMFVLVLRFSAVPGHITTAVSASAGANFWSYLAAAFLTLPKQFTIVYLGQAFGTKSRKNAIISTVTLVLTMIGTVVAAVFIYYQMRLVMRRRAMIIPVAVVPMSEAPTWADVAAGAASGSGADGADRRRSMGGVIILSPSPVDEKIDAQTVQSALERQGSWLYSSNPHATKPKLRAWSVPHHMAQEEMREFMAEMEASQGTVTPAIRVGEDELLPPPQFSESWQKEKNQASSTSLTSSPTGLTPFRDTVSPRPDSRLGLLDETGSMETTYPPSSSSAAPISGRPRLDTRSTMSLDLAVPVGGRQIADDADMYALARGGRRPDYGRTRGESRAALLGRPGDDDADSTRSG